MTALDKFFASTNYKITQLQITQEIEFIGKILLTGLEIVAIFFFLPFLPKSGTGGHIFLLYLI